MPLTEEDKKRIEEEERYRTQVRQEHTKPAKKGIGCGAIILIVIIAPFVIAGMILSGASQNSGTNSMTPTVSPAPVVSKSEIKDMTQRYYNSHVSMNWFPDQVDKGTLTLDYSETVIRNCINDLQSKNRCNQIIDKNFG